MSSFNFGQQNEYQRGNRRRARFQSWRPNRARGNGPRDHVHQTWTRENDAWGAVPEFDLSSADGIGDQRENKRGQGRPRPRGRGRHWRRGRGEGSTTSDEQPLFAGESFVIDNNDEYVFAGRSAFEQNTRSHVHQTWTRENDARGATAEFDSLSADGIGDQNENKRGQRKQQPRGRGRHWRRGRGEGFTTSDEQPSYAGESFVIDNSDDYYPGSERSSTLEQNSRSGQKSSSAASGTERRTEYLAAERPVRVDQNRILHFLVTSHDGCCLVSDLRENRALIESLLTPNAVVLGLKQCKKIKVLRNEDNLDSSVVKAFIKSLRICFQYKHPKPCTNARCHHLHLCRDFVMDCCFMKHCSFSHDVESPHNEIITNDCGVQIFSPDQQLSLIRCANVMVCREHNSSGRCHNSDSCIKLHICNAYVMNKCLLLDCPEGHDPFSERNKKVLQLHEMENLPIETIFRMMLVFRKQPQRSTKYAGNCSDTKEVKPASTQRRSEVEHEEDETKMKVPYEAAPLAPRAPPPANLMSFTKFVQLKVDSSLLYDEGSKDICDTFEEHSCDLKENCTDRHNSRTPYLWRVKLSGNWISLDKENSAIERAFCDPYIDEFWAMDSVPGEQVRLNFMSMNSDCGPIQRLSTPSYVEIRDKVDACEWLWYWYDGNQWIPYGQSDEPPHLDVLEAKYQRDPKLRCCFEFGSTLYELDFAKMEQKNLRTHYVRNVKRRPLYVERVEWATRRLELSHYDASKLPSDWVPMDTESKDGTELVPLHSKADAHQRVAAEFFKTIDKKNHLIRRIYKVQNLELWNNYKTKKESIDKYMGNETEVNVFHGTAEEGTTRWICGVGFDQRMYGVNGTVYGKGAYFATTAKYSHGYTQPSPRKFRYMFYAKITIGKVARGDSSLKRPPAIDPNYPNKGLYDSCANNVTDPSIYVIFDNNQTYPDYLIEYRDINPDPISDHSSLLQSQAYARAFNAATSQPSYVFPSTAQNSSPFNQQQLNNPLPNSIPSNLPPANPSISNPSISNPPPSNPPSVNPLPSNPLGSRPTASQTSSTRSRTSKESSCLLM